MVLFRSTKQLHAPRGKHQPREKVHDLSLNKLVVADLYYIRHTFVIGAYIIFHRVIMVIIGVTPYGQFSWMVSGWSVQPDVQGPTVTVQVY
jgi:hypothetical protein